MCTERFGTVPPLHGGHKHTEAASAGVTSELLVVSVLVLVAALIGYAVSRYAGINGF